MTNSDPKLMAQMVNTLSLILKERAADLDTVAIPGFGNFVAMKKQERIIFDSNDGTRKLMPPEIKVEFVAGSKLKRQVLAHE